MWIKRKDYRYLKDQETAKQELEKEVTRLSELITSEVKDCKLGPWCKGCKHYGCDYAEIKGFDGFGCSTYTKFIAGKVFFCKKHIHDSCCPEYEK